MFEKTDRNKRFIIFSFDNDPKSVCVWEIFSNLPKGHKNVILAQSQAHIRHKIFTSLTQNEKDMISHKKKYQLLMWKLAFFSLRICIFYVKIDRKLEKSVEVFYVFCPEAIFSSIVHSGVNSSPLNIGTLRESRRKNNVQPKYEDSLFFYFDCYGWNFNF